MLRRALGWDGDGPEAHLAAPGQRGAAGGLAQTGDTCVSFLPVQTGLGGASSAGVGVGSSSFALLLAPGQATPAAAMECRGTRLEDWKTQWRNNLRKSALAALVSPWLGLEERMAGIG